MAENRKLYNGAYRSQIEEEDNSPKEPISQDAGGNNTSDVDPNTPEERTWKKRYGDLRTHTNDLTERVKSLELQLRSSNKKEIQIPSTKEELEGFARQYPDVFRNIRSMVMIELLQERENIAQETEVVKQNLHKVQRDLGMKRILQAHSDFNELNLSEDFHEWADKQPTQIKDWLFADEDPELCIKAIDLYKAERDFVKKNTQPRVPERADMQIRGSRNAPEIGTGKDGTIWKASEIAKLTPRQYMQHEAEIDKANREGRIDLNA